MPFVAPVCGSFPVAWRGRGSHMVGLRQKVVTPSRSRSGHKRSHHPKPHEKCGQLSPFANDRRAYCILQAPLVGDAPAGRLKHFGTTSLKPETNLIL